MTDQHLIAAVGLGAFVIIILAVLVGRRLS